MVHETRVYAGDQLPRDHRLNVVLRAHWDEGLTSEERVERYGPRLTAFSLVPLHEAELVLLPRTWEGSSTAERRHFAELAHDSGKPLLIFAGGDLEPRVDVVGSMLFHPGPHRSIKRAGRAFALPYFFSDRRSNYTRAGPRIKQPRPTIGFCGQATGRLPAQAVHALRRATHVFRARIGLTELVPPPWRGHLPLRRRVLRLLEDSSLVDTRFIVRSRYRAGVRSAPELRTSHPTQLEFDENILDTDYTVCVRGTGNFSARLYETLSLGRIPILVDTDSVLPYDFRCDWKRYCVWVEQADVPRIGELVSEFHHRLSASDFEELQVRCRTFWEERLSIEGFFSHFRDHLDAKRAE